MRLRLWFAATAVLTVAGSLGIGICPSAAAPARAARGPQAGTVHWLSKGVIGFSGLGCPLHAAVSSSTCLTEIDNTNDQPKSSLFFVDGQPQAPVDTKGNGDVQCPTQHSCVLLTQSSPPVLRWLSDGRPSGTTTVNGMQDAHFACPTATHCVVVGVIAQSGRYPKIAHGAIAVASSRQATVSAHRVSGIARFFGIGCLSATRCVASGSTHDPELQAGGHGAWVSVLRSTTGAVHAVSGTTELRSVSCGSQNSCWVNAEHDGSNGANYRLFVIRDGKAGPLHKSDFEVGLSCWNDTSCVLVGQSYGSKYTYVQLRQKGSLAGSTHVTGLAYGVSVSCPTASRCLMVGSDIHLRSGYLYVTP